MDAQLLPLFDEPPPEGAPASAEERSAPDGPVPATLDLMTAAGLLGIGRTCAYAMIRTGQWPTPILRAGRAIRIPTRPLLAALGVELSDFHRLLLAPPPGG